MSYVIEYLMFICDLVKGNLNKVYKKRLIL